METQPSDGNGMFSFEDLPTDMQEKVLLIMRKLKLSSIEVTMGYIQGMAVAKAFDDYNQKDAYKGCEDE